VDDPLGRGRTVNWLDFDSDGDLDVFVGNEFRRGHPNLTFRNDRGTFTEVRVGIRAELATMASVWADPDRDGDPDLLVLTHGPEGAVFYRNLGGRFEQQNLQGVSGRRWTSAAWGDFDGDGWPDLHLVSRWRAVLLRNDAGRLVPHHSMKLKAGRMSAWFDADNDGDLDLFLIQGRPRKEEWGRTNGPDILLLQEGGTFRVHHGANLGGPLKGSADSAVVADFDRDGREDLLVTNGYLESWGRVQLFRNHTRAGNSIGLTLIGTRWNPLGMGATVTVRTDRMRYRRQITDGANFKAQADVGHLVLGIGPALSADIQVAWPDGRKDCVAGLAGVPLRLEIGTRPCAKS
jgi:hypothetical protein